MTDVKANPDTITIVVDGVEIEATPGAMLADAAKGGDVEIPVFCYEPKLGGPVGACRMCLVEIEGIPKLQTACSTPVRDGMVVYTRTDRVKVAQNSVVEFLLVNHPLDCPVCDKGGECPLQDIAMGWGPGKSRVTDPKRHFQKPVPLSPLVRIDRERCILCYRCVRFSQEVSEDEQLQLLERGANSYVGTFDDRPYITPFHGNIIELCPVGALTSEAYRFRARPWDIEDAGSVCTLCPSQCNVKFTVRDERPARVLARDNHDVDDGWLCDKGRFGFQAINSHERIVAPSIRMGSELVEVSWAEALEAAAKGLRENAARAGVGAIVGGQSSNEEGWLTQRILRGALGSRDIDSRRRGALGREAAVRLTAPELSAAVSDLDSAESILVIGTDPMHEMPILDLRIRKAVRRSNARLVVATDRPTALDGGAIEAVRYAPGAANEFLSALVAELRRGSNGHGHSHESAYSEAAEQAAGELRPGRTVVVWGERIAEGRGGAEALALLSECASLLSADAIGAGLIGVPEETNARGLREVGCLPDAGPGLVATNAGRSAPEIREALRDGDLTGLVLVNSNPVRDHPMGRDWADALRKARFVLAVSAFDDESTKHANVVFPAETYAEKEGTVTHPDGRLQRLRPGVPHPGMARPIWHVLVELSALLDAETGLDSASEVLDAIAAEAGFLAGVTPEEIGGTGVRWPERPASASFPRIERGEDPTAAILSRISGRERRHPVGDELVRVGTYRDLWSSETTERSPALAFLAPAQRIELSPHDAERLGVRQGEIVHVSAASQPERSGSVRARVLVRERIRPGSAFMLEATERDTGAVFHSGEGIEITPAGPELAVTQRRPGAAS
ncbi:NADH-quinone oxidoreductase subunit NuoG [Thermoleophilia bacterium SCSIO 60948]|nr:NADH-quinone oxidoreductase subunit NuoG [Thermoleophilia bacterium SCSIO 60948]